MKRVLFILCAVLAVSAVSAQRPPMGPPPGMQQQGSDRDRADRMAKRIEHLKNVLDMTDEQAAKFAPIYQSYQREVSGIRKDLKAVMDSYKDKEIDEKTSYKLVMAQLKADGDIIACKKEYLRVFKDYLTPEQMSKIFLVENRPQHGGHRPDGHHGGVPRSEEQDAVRSDTPRQ